MVTTSIQDRTNEFRTVLIQAQKRQNTSKVGSQRASLLSDVQRREANGSAGSERRARSEFARNAAQVGRGITATMGKLERLAQLAKRKTLFDDRPVEISELTYIIKQDLASLNSQISSLQSLNQSLHPNALQPKSADQEGQHNKNVVVMLQGKVADVAASFKDVLEVRTKNIQASRSRTENFVSSVSAKTATGMDAQRSESPLYQSTGTNRQRTPQAAHSSSDLLSLEPSSSSTLMRHGQQSDSQLLMMEEAQPTNTYIQQRGEAIEAIERTINELGGIFGQLASMVSEQSEMIQRIDANTEDVVDNVQGAQRELLKYWSRVSGNRWLVAKMFGVLMSNCLPGEGAAKDSS
ncbi:hypothetical protein EPUS_05388 [Endocarpon pusillum Z07020]|uniref:t-SNARE coiled-coil homology domain-containing protein n=1 Tax=Endocarpon pusillum (strain Z07020 / HMAS-L-300199) TaxID=1263415 RepID=U1HTN0_ENDPU|nr:uncharacterized protein EPUS_05388 [Endocarpon pusillum Z07020]ERF73965.1 hypothetical protein EPUS_05388 [Endocarpon pusillum Z07020]